MGQGLRAICIALVVVAGAVACEMGENGSESERATSSGEATTTLDSESVEVESSLEGMAILPRHVRWIVTTSLPAEKIREVRFAVNGTRVWTDHDPPYAYGEEGAYLVTSYFHDSYWDETRGGQRFTARVIEWGGVTWRSVVVARVPRPQTTRRFLSPTSYRIWGRLSAAALEDPPPLEELGYSSSSYTSELRLLDGGLWVGRTVERAFAYEVSADATVLRVGAPIFFGSLEVAGNQSGWFFKGYQCSPDGPRSSYAWSLQRRRYLGRSTGDSRTVTHLVLKARNEPCEPRRKILEGVWYPLD
jgi:hypothetical protein